jgi:FAD/FMN-containing dehydrogenase
MMVANHKHAFSQILDPARVLDDPSSLHDYGRDRTRVHEPAPSLVLFPKTTEEVVRIAEYCARERLPIVPSGGRTGYAGAAVAAHGEVVVSMGKMDRILGIDLESGCVEVEAGAILENVQHAVAETGMYLPLDFAARGSAQIGGCIATNAGGLKVIKYGMTRELVLGLEAVFGRGQVLRLNTSLHKNNSGYDLKQFLVGAEGTLGIVTRATMQIVPQPKRLNVGLIALSRLADTPPVLKEARLRSLDLTAAEFFTGACLEAVMAHLPQMRSPFPIRYPCYLLIEIDEGEHDGQLTAFLEHVSGIPGIEDATVATSPQSFRELWALRENISESIGTLGLVHKNDIAVPVSSMPAFVGALESLVRERYRGLDVLLFGHIGDGNVHVNVIDRTSKDAAGFETRVEELDTALCELIQSYNGSISAEHGIGLLKKRLLHLQRDPVQIELMKAIKHTFDPANIFNPGKIVDW